MPTVANMVDSICSDAGVSGVTDSTDRIKALSCLNRAYSQVTNRYRCIKRVATLTLTASTQTDLVISSVAGYSGTDFTDSAPTRFAGIDGVFTATGELPQDSLLRVYKSRLGASSGEPTVYAYSTGVIHLDKASSSTVLTVVCYSYAATLIDGSVEAEMDGVTPGWQEALLIPLATAILLEGYEGEEERASYARVEADKQLALFAREQTRSGGLEGIRSSVSDLTTPAPLAGR
jgi:hypothetical protein